VTRWGNRDFLCDTLGQQRETYVTRWGKKQEFYVTRWSNKERLLCDRLGVTNT